MHRHAYQTAPSANGSLGPSGSCRLHAHRAVHLLGRDVPREGTAAGHPGEHHRLVRTVVEEIPAQEIDEVSVSSTKVRNALEEGDLETANAYLGYEYTLSGEVEKGKKLGRDLGFPTANLRVSAPYKLIPAAGVYVVRCPIDGKEHFGMMNIGTKNG